MPGLTFPTVGRLGITSPPFRFRLWNHRYYVPLRLPNVHPGFVHSSLSAPVPCIALLYSLIDSAQAVPIHARISPVLRRSAILAGMCTRKHPDLPSFRVTPMNACPDLRPRWCPEHIALACSGLLPSDSIKPSAFPLSQQSLSILSTTISISRLRSTACILVTPGFVHTLTGVARGLTTDLLAKL